VSEKQATGLLGAASLDALLAGLIDYAGLFPPAAIDMKSAVENYAKYLAGPYARALGRFVLPVSRFAEFEDAFAHVQPVEPWGISALVGANYEAEMMAIDKFNDRNARDAYVDVIEAKANTPEEIAHIRAFVRGTITPYFEIRPFDCTELLQTIQHIRGRAKIRTGGLTPEAFPPSDIVAGFLTECAKLEVPFKATAGLHHPVRCEKPLTNEPGAPAGSMHGFLNVFVAATAAWASNREIEVDHDYEVRDGATLRAPFPTRFSCDAKLIQRLLRTVSPFDFRDDGIRTPVSLPRKAVELARQNFAISFGSCSFEEPIADLKALNLL
jgi:hypothetical protein